MLKALPPALGCTVQSAAFCLQVLVGWMFFSPNLLIILALLLLMVYLIRRLELALTWVARRFIRVNPKT
jgi:hypothetical protein